jgi:hypothetical protein
MGILQLLEEQARAGKITDDQLARYSAALNKNGRCDPNEGIMCNGELVCDLSNKVCVDQDLADERANPDAPASLHRVEIGGKTYIGSPFAIRTLKNKLAPPIKPPVQPVRPPLKRPSKKPGKKAPPVVPPPPDKPPEGTVVPDIEDILRRLEAGDTGDIADLAECQREVLKCLALTA